MSDQREIILNGEKRITLQQGETLFQAILRAGVEGVFCGGNGLCGKCRVRFRGHAPLPSAADRKFFQPEELRQGCRLACLVKVEQLQENPIELDTFFPQAVSYPILSEYQADVSSILKQLDNQPELKPENFTIADIGTTTIVMQRIEAKTGRCLAQYRSLNPQRRYGADVISRIQAAIEGKGEELQSLIQNEVLKGLFQLEQQCGKAKRVIMAANTTMTCLFQGIDVSALSQAPFGIPNEIRTEMEWKEYQVMMFPAAAAFVGGDIVAGVMALGMHQDQKQNLFLDLGTNGELAAGNNEHLFMTSVAAGPAFENSKSYELPGSDIIRTIAKMLQEGIVDATGLLKEQYFEDGYPVGRIRIMNEDIREIQKAKAAVSEGMITLLNKAGIRMDQIANVYLAGGFGQGLGVESAIRIGLFPKELREKVKAVGNTALAGAYLYGMKQQHGFQNSILEKCNCVNLAQEAMFSERYMEAMNFIY